MSGNQLNISPFSSEKERKLVIQTNPITSYTSDESCYSEIGDLSSSIGSPIRSIFCLKQKEDMKRIEEIEDCFILEFDPYDPLDVFNLAANNNLIHAHPDAANDLFIIAEKGQVACRDYPHSRHLCLNFPFETTPQENYCNLCYCYVCDSAAPCKYWTEPEPAHCHASEHVGDWKSQRNLRKWQPVAVWK